MKEDMKTQLLTKSPKDLDRYYHRTQKARGDLGVTYGHRVSSIVIFKEKGIILATASVSA